MPGPLPIVPIETRTPIESYDSFSRSADRAYHALTIVAILIVLGSLWVF